MGPTNTTARTWRSYRGQVRRAGTPAVLDIQATLLERLVSLKLAGRLPPSAPGASYRYRISDKGTRLLNSSE